MLNHGRKTGETDSNAMVASDRPRVTTTINESEDRDADIESEASIIMSRHDSSDEMKNSHLEDEI